MSTAGYSGDSGGGNSGSSGVGGEDNCGNGGGGGGWGCGEADINQVGAGYGDDYEEDEGKGNYGRCIGGVRIDGDKDGCVAAALVMAMDGTDDSDCGSDGSFLSCGCSDVERQVLKFTHYYYYENTSHNSFSITATTPLP